MVFHWSLSDGKCPQDSRTFLGIQADLNNAVVWMVYVRPLISKPSSFLTKLLRTVPCASIIIGITVTFLFHHIILLWQGPSICLSFRFLKFHSMFRWENKVNHSADSFFFSFLLIITRSGRLVEFRWSVCKSKSQRIWCVSFSRADSGLWIYH